MRWLKSLFAWHEVEGVGGGVWRYEENAVTGARRAYRVMGGHQPQNIWWLKRLPKPISAPPPSHDD